MSIQAVISIVLQLESNWERVKAAAAVKLQCRNSRMFQVQFEDFKGC